MHREEGEVHVGVLYCLVTSHTLASITATSAVSHAPVTRRPWPDYRFNFYRFVMSCVAARKQKSRRPKEDRKQQEHAEVQQSLPMTVGSSQLGGMAGAAGAGNVKGVCLCLVCCCLVCCFSAYLFVAFKKTLE